MSRAMSALLLLALVVLLVRADNEWYVTRWVDCYGALSVENKVREAFFFLSTLFFLFSFFFFFLFFLLLSFLQIKVASADIQRAVRRVTSSNHPDRCKTPECAVRFADANNCKDTLLDAKKRAKYDELWPDGPRVVAMGPPKTSALLIVLLLAIGASLLQYRSLKLFAEHEYRKELATLVARKKFSEQLDAELRLFYRLDSPISLLRELWLARALLALPSLLRSSASVAAAPTSSLVVAAPSVKRDPSSAAVYALLHQGSEPKKERKKPLSKNTNPKLFSVTFSVFC